MEVDELEKTTTTTTETPFLRFHQAVAHPTPIRIPGRFDGMINGEM
jgi:hypothetical protein